MTTTTTAATSTTTAAPSTTTAATSTTTAATRGWDHHQFIVTLAKPDRHFHDFGQIEDH